MKFLIIFYFIPILLSIFIINIQANAMSKIIRERGYIRVTKKQFNLSVFISQWLPFIIPLLNWILLISMILSFESNTEKVINNLVSQNIIKKGE